MCSFLHLFFYIKQYSQFSRLVKRQIHHALLLSQNTLLALFIQDKWIQQQDISWIWTLEIVHLGSFQPQESRFPVLHGM